MHDSHDALLNRIHADGMDGYDEELELEIEDRHLDGSESELSPKELLARKASRRRSFRELFRL